MKAVSNASPLIFLAKIGKLDLIEKYEIILPKEVLDEIAEGSKIGREDAHKIEDLVEKKTIKVEETDILKELEKQNIGNGEKSAISLAINKKISLVLLDERKARRIAKFYGLKARGTIGILIDALKNNRISKKDLKDLVQKLLNEGYRISEEVIIKLFREIE